MIFLGLSVLILAIPIGLILKRMTIEEMESGRIYFNILWLSSIILAIAFYFIPMSNVYDQYTIIFGLLFIAIISFISWKNPRENKIIIGKGRK